MDGSFDTIHLAQGQVATRLGAGRVVVIGRRDQPLELARRCGAADAVVNAAQVDPVEAIMGLTDGAGAEVVLESAGGHADVISLAGSIAAFGGEVGTVGGSGEVIELDPDVWLAREVDLRQINSYSTWDGVSEFAMALDLLASKAVDVASLITHRVPLSAIREGFELAADKARSSATKVLVLP